MGWVPFKWFENGPEKRIAYARKLLAREEYNEVRLELVGIDHPEAAKLLAAALEALIQLNLLEWRSQTNAGHSTEAGEALARARKFGASEERIKEFRDSRGTESLSANHRLPHR